MDKNIIKIKFNTLIIVIMFIVLLICGITGAVLFRQDKDSNMNLLKEETNNEENFIKIRYAYAYNVSTAEALNKMSQNGKYIDILEINLKGETFNKVNKLLEKQSYEKIDKFMLAVVDMYEININDEIKISICPGSNYADYTKGNESFIIEISEELVNEIDRIAQEEASKNIKYFSTEKITITSEDDKQVIINDTEHIKNIVEKSGSVKVNINEDELKNERISYVVDLNNGTKIYVYFASCLGKITNENGEKYYVAFIGDYENIIKIIFENYISGRNENIRADEVLIKYLGKKYYIKNDVDIKFIINQLKLCGYNTYGWLKRFNEKDYGEKDIIITIGNSKVIIPGNRTIGDRYFIDYKGNAYTISGFKELENYFKELVEYKD